MPSAEPGAPAVRPADVEAWLTDLGVEPLERADRDSVTSWDLVLDGRRRFDLSVTLILDPSLGLICWAHYAPPINDMFRKSYRRLLRWNDEFVGSRIGPSVTTEASRRIGLGERHLPRIAFGERDVTKLEAARALSPLNDLEVTTAREGRSAPARLDRRGGETLPDQPLLHLPWRAPS